MPKILIPLLLCCFLSSAQSKNNNALSLYSLKNSYYLSSKKQYQLPTLQEVLKNQPSYTFSSFDSASGFFITYTINNTLDKIDKTHKAIHSNQPSPIMWQHVKSNYTLDPITYIRPEQHIIQGLFLSIKDWLD